MPAKHVAIDVSPTSLEVATLQGGRVVSTCTERLEPTDWSAAWPAVLSTLDEPLARVVGKLGVRGAVASVLYAGPTSVHAVFSCPSGAGGAAGEQAAALALAGLCTFPTDSNPRAMRRIAVDSSSGAGEVGPQAHTLAVADTDESVAAVVGWIRRAGLRPTVVLPGGAPALVFAVRAALECKPGDPPQAVLWIGEYGSILAAGHGGRLLFVRNLAVGTESLVDALGRPIRTRGQGGTVTLDRAQARALLASSGIPLATDVLDVERGIEGSGVLPLIQPILQRITIETKQSLRFGLSEEERGKVRLRVIGPGGGIARLGETLGRQCGTVVVAPTVGPDEAAGRAGNIGALTAIGASKVTLTPRTVEQAAMVRRLRMGLWAGTAASLVLIGAEWMASTRDLDRLGIELATVKAAADERNARTEVQDRAIGSRTRAMKLEQRVWRQLGEPADFAAVLVLLGEATSPRVRLTDIEMGADGSGPSCRISGYMLAGPGSDTASVITRYIDDLSAVPIVKSVRLGTTQRTEVSGGLGQRFELGVKLLGLPPKALFAQSDPSAPARGGEGR